MGGLPSVVMLYSEVEETEALKIFLAHLEHSVVGESPSLSLSPPSTVILSPSLHYSGCCAGFFTDSDSELAKAFKTAADGLHGSFRFAHTTAETVLTEFNYRE